MDIADNVYALIEGFPKFETYGRPFRSIKESSSLYTIKYRRRKF